MQNGFGGAGTVIGTIVTFIFIGFFLFNTAVYNYSFGRLLFVSGLDRRLPTFMSKVNANKVPYVAVLVQSIIAGFFAALAFIIVPYTLSTGLSSTDLSTVVYNILQAAVTVIWCISMVILFVDVIIIRFRFHETFHACASGAGLGVLPVFSLWSHLECGGCRSHLYLTLDTQFDEHFAVGSMDWRDRCALVVGRYHRLLDWTGNDQDHRE